MFDYDREKVLKILSRRRNRLIIISAVIFLIHFSVSWFLSYPYLEPDVINVFLERFIETFNMTEIGALPQMNPYTGNFFVMIPVLELIGYTPSDFLLILTSMTAFSSVFTFLALEKYFDLSYAVLGILFLFNTGNWILFRYPDYVVVMFTSTLLLYTFVLWKTIREPKFLYLFTFLGGLSFYFKAINMYLLVGLAVGTLAQDKKELFRQLDLKILILSALFFLVGASPFIAMTFEQVGSLQNPQPPGWYNWVTTPEDNYRQVEPEISVIFERRLSHASSLVDHYVVRDGNRDFDPGLFSFLLFTGLIASATQRAPALFSTAYIVLFGCLFYIMNGLTRMQMMITLPVSAFVVINNLELVSAGRYLKIFAGVALLIGFLALLINPPELVQYPWMITTDSYNEFRGINESDRDLVATNFHNLFYVSKYDPESRVIFLIEEEPELGSKKDLAGLRDARMTIDEFEDRGLHRDVTFIIYDIEECPDVAGCGVETDRIEQRFNLSNPQRIEISNFLYRMYTAGNHSSR